LWEKNFSPVYFFMKAFDILLNESLESYEQFYSLLLQQLQSFHQENLEIKSNYYSEQIKNSSLLSQISQSQQTIDFLTKSLKTSQLDYEELQYQHQNLQDISVGNYSSETMNSLLDEISELKEMKSQRDLEIFDLKQKNIQLESHFMHVQRKCDLLETELVTLRCELTRIHSKYRNEAYENFIKVYQIIQEEAVDIMSHLPEVTIRPSPAAPTTEVLTIPSTTSPAHILLYDPTLSSSHLSSSHGLFLYTSPSASPTQQIFHQIVNFPLNGILFESFTALLFQCYGYRPHLRSHSYDNGIDIDLSYSDPTRTWRGVVQCKQYTYKLGSGIIREFIGSMLNDGCHSGYLVTTSFFTREANKTAEIWRQKGNQLELWDAQILLEKITPHADYLLSEIKEMRRRQQDSEMSRVGGVDLSICDYLKVQEVATAGAEAEAEAGAGAGAGVDEEEEEETGVCFTRGDRAFSLTLHSTDSIYKTMNTDEQASSCSKRSDGSKDNSRDREEGTISASFADLTVSPLRQSPPLDENNSRNSNKNTPLSPHPLSCSSSPLPPPLSQAISSKLLPSTPHSLSHHSRPPQSRSPPATPTPTASCSSKTPLHPNASTPRATSPKRCHFRSPFMVNDKGFTWSNEETHALSLLVTKFSQNSVTQRVNWGQMESWLKLPEGMNDPVGRLIREEHKDKEKLRSKWKNEGRVNPKLTSTSGATHLSPGRVK
jgi:HJR/Mrr/RecB family endonuclease